MRGARTRGRRLRLRRRAIRVAIGAVAIVLLLFVLLRAIENRMLYFPERGLYGSPADVGLDFTDVSLVTSDEVRLHAWHVRVPNPKAIVVHLHGNAGNVSMRVPFATAFASVGLDTLLVEYRGYGKSEGSPSEEGLYRDADAAFEWASGRGLPLVLYGESLGGAVAIDLAARRRVALLVAQSTFTRLSEMANRVLPLAGFVVSQRFDSIEKIRTVRDPILVIHGDRDDIVPYRMGVRLHEAAPEPKSMLTLPGARHNDVVDLFGDRIASRIEVTLRGSN